MFNGFLSRHLTLTSEKNSTIVCFRSKYEFPIVHFGTMAEGKKIQFETRENGMNEVNLDLW